MKEAATYAARQSAYDPGTGAFTAKENFWSSASDTSYSKVTESNDIVKAARANAQLPTETSPAEKK